MKRDKYLADLERVTAQASDSSDIEKMRGALADARANLERKDESIRRAEFKRRNGQ